MRGVANVGAGVERWEDPLHHHVLGRCDCHQTLEIVHRSRKSPGVDYHRSIRCFQSR